MNIVAYMVADIEVDMVVDMVADMVANMEVNQLADMVANVRDGHGSNLAREMVMGVGKLGPNFFDLKLTTRPGLHIF